MSLFLAERQSCLDVSMKLLLVFSQNELASSQDCRSAFFRVDTGIEPATDESKKEHEYGKVHSCPFLLYANVARERLRISGIMGLSSLLFRSC